MHGNGSIQPCSNRGPFSAYPPSFCFDYFSGLTRTIHTKEKLLLEKQALEKTNQQLTQAYKTTNLGAL